MEAVLGVKYPKERVRPIILTDDTARASSIYVGLQNKTVQQYCGETVRGLLLAAERAAEAELDALQQAAGDPAMPDTDRTSLARRMWCK